jgi:chromosome segregation ATPase
MKYTLLLIILLPSLALAVSGQPDPTVLPQEPINPTTSSLENTLPQPPLRRVESAREQVNQRTQEAQRLETGVDTINSSEAPQRQVEANQRRQESRERVCENTAKRLENQIRRYENITQNHQTRHQRVITRLNQLTLKFESEAINTAELKSATQELQVKSDQLEQNLQNYINTLIESENLACEQDQAKLRETLQTAQAMTPAIRAEILAIRTFFQTDILPIMLSIRTELEERRSQTQTPDGENL